MSKAHQKQISTLFVSTGILYQPGISNAFKSTSVGIFLSQMLYWHELGSRPDGWMYKTVEEMQMETGLTQAQQKYAIKICVDRGFLQRKRAGIPAKRHFLLDVEKLEYVLVSLGQSTELSRYYSPNNTDGYTNSITETTQNTTQTNSTTNTTLEDKQFDEIIITDIGSSEELAAGMAKWHDYK